jgi:hypothetical protein
VHNQGYFDFLGGSTSCGTRLRDARISLLYALDVQLDRMLAEGWRVIRRAMAMRTGLGGRAVSSSPEDCNSR